MVDFILKENNDGPFDLKSTLKTYTYDQDKYIHPQVTYAKTYRKVKRNVENAKLIIITEEKPVFSYDFSNEKITTHGKGVTMEQAKSSAIMEFSERYSWLNFDYKNAPGYMVASFNELAEQEDMSYIEPGFVFHNFEKSKDFEVHIKSIPIKWIDGYSLTQKKTIKYPLSWINYMHGSNGICTGNIKEEAIVQGICEVIERNNCNKFVKNYKKEKINIIDNESIEHEGFKEMLDFFKKEHTELYLLHIPTGCDLPVIMAICINEKLQPQVLSQGIGYGCHTDPVKAVLRAVTEYFQARTGIIEKQKKVPFDMAIAKSNSIFSLDLDIDWIVKNNKLIHIKDIKNLSSNDFKEEIETLINITKQSGLEILIASKMHPKLEIPVYRVFSPQAEPPVNLCSNFHVPEYIVAQMYYEAGMIDKSEEFIQENRERICCFPYSLFDNFAAPMFGEEFSNLAKNTIKRSKISADQICRKDYLLLHVNVASVGKDAEDNFRRFSSIFK
jgi:ribosomal protein S12 methylthiotransferase accessory factor